jgi:hypothetical protein
MSFDIWLFCFKDGGEGFFPTSIVKDAFAQFHGGNDGEDWIPQFPNGGRCEVTVGEEPMTFGFMINRPNGDGLYDAIYQIMRQTQTALSWSFGGAATANPSVIPHLPPEMIKSVGVPTIVYSGEDIIKAIESS